MPDRSRMRPFMMNTTPNVAGRLSIQVHSNAAEPSQTPGLK